MTASVATRIPPEVLAEQYYGLMHSLISQLQAQFRARPDLTQKQMGQRIGKQPAVVSRSLAGQENLTVRSMHDLARAMDCRFEVTLVPLSQVKPSNRPIAQMSANVQVISGSQPIEFLSAPSPITSAASGSYAEIFQND